jgi:hypothetical protein
LQTVWKDPACGDGICESPFEFASYGRFGCRADCGLLSQVQQLTTIQVDIYFDFSHPLGSIAASVRLAAGWMWLAAGLGRACRQRPASLPACCQEGPAHLLASSSGAATSLPPCHSSRPNHAHPPNCARTHSKPN